MNAKPSYHLNPSDPSWVLPAGACDTHCHIFGPEKDFPYATGRTYTPQGEAPKQKLFDLHGKLGIERCVIVQAGCHGFDNSVVADAMAAKEGAYLGVALLPADVDIRELKRHDTLGFRAVRFNFMQHLGTGSTLDEVIAMTPRLADIGWHLQVHMESVLIEGMSSLLRKSVVPVVIDHMGRVDASLGLDQPDFIALQRLLDDDHFWVKVSGVERASRQEAPYANAIPFAHKLVEKFGDRVLWGTDWPHPNLAGAVPDDGLLADLIRKMAPTEKQRQALLVDNPARLYGFEERLIGVAK